MREGDTKIGIIQPLGGGIIIKDRLANRIQGAIFENRGEEMTCLGTRGIWKW